MGTPKTLREAIATAIPTGITPNTVLEKYIGDSVKDFLSQKFAAKLLETGDIRFRELWKEITRED